MATSAVLSDIPRDARGAVLSVAIDTTSSSVASLAVEIISESDEFPTTEQKKVQSNQAQTPAETHINELCVDSCGDGYCSEVVCLGSNCPCIEDENSCPSDCGISTQPVDESEDDSQSFFCLAIFEPVCGVDNHTYGNECEATVAGVKVKAKEPCESDSLQVF